MKLHGITFTIIRKNIKHTYLRVLPPKGEITLTVPLDTDENQISEIIKTKKKWILKKQKSIKEKSIPPNFKYTSGEEHYLWGEKYTLQLISNKNVKSAIVNHENLKIYLPISKENTIENREKKLIELYRREVKNALPEKLNKCINIVGVKPASVKIRKMVNWGNCNQKGEITFNLNLAKKDPICLDYVIIHELCHLIEFNHGKKFKKLMNEFCPKWKQIKNKLNE